MARPRPQVATTTAVLILFLVAKVVSSGEATTIVLRPPHGGSNHHTMFLPLFLSPPPSSSSGNSSPSVRRQIQGSDPLHPNARMLLYDDLLLNGYLAEAHVQAMQFDEAENLSKKTLEIHRVHSPPASLEEAADRRLMALICEAKGDYESALEHLVLASMAMIANEQENEVGSIDVSIGNIYMSLSRFDEAVFSYQKALTVFKSSKGDNHPSVASVFVYQP